MNAHGSWPPVFSPLGTPNWHITHTATFITEEVEVFICTAMAPRDPASEQLSGWKNSQNGTRTVLTSAGGAPVGDLTHSMTAGPRGPLLLQDAEYLEHLQAFDRERIPERVVHANGSGAFGYFEVTTDEGPKYCKAKMFEKIGKRTPMVARFSTVGGETGTPDTARDPRGFSLKFYTEEGNWDMVGNNTPIFFMRDPILFPSFIHTQKRNPQTHLKDPDMFWDFLSLRPESVHQTTILFSDRGTPDGYCHMNGYGSHTFKNVNAQGEAVYVKYHFKTDQGILNLPADKAAELGGTDPDYAQRDLYNRIASGNYPSWTMYLQVMPYEEAHKRKTNPFDLTKTWSHKEFPLIEVGRFTLNKNPENYFSDVEQAAYDPSNMIPGIEPSPDKVLQGRLMSYLDAHRHRLGANYEQLPVNMSCNTQVNNYQKDGPARIYNQGGAPNYWPNSFSGPAPDPSYKAHEPKTDHGEVGLPGRYNDDDDDNYSECAIMYSKVFDEGAKDRLTTNIAGHLGGAAEFIQERMIKVLKNVDPDYGQRVHDKIEANKKKSEPEEKDDRKPAPLNPPRQVPQKN